MNIEPDIKQIKLEEKKGTVRLKITNIGKTELMNKYKTVLMMS